jgi:WD40 repeat protein
MEMDIEQASRRKASKQRQEESKETQRMSVVISAGASTEVVLEVFAEMINSIARLKTSLSSEDTLRSRPYSANPHADFEKALGRISSGLHSSLKVLDAFRESVEPKGQWAWAPYASRFCSDLQNANQMLTNIRDLLVKLHGANAMVDVTELIDKMAERIKLRTTELSSAVTAWDSDQQKRNANSLTKSLVEEKGFEKERERLQILAEADVVSQKCHRSGELEKLPIVKRTLVKDSPVVETSKAGLTAELRAKAEKTNSTDKTTTSSSKPASSNWRKRYFFLDYKALTYSHNTKGQSDQTKPEDTTTTSLVIDHTTTAFTVDEKSQPGVFTIVHATYEFTVRAATVDEGYHWVNAVNKIGGVHRARNDRERKWFADKSQNQWWGDIVPSPESLSAKNWEELFASVIQRWPAKTADLITPKKSVGKFRTTSSELESPSTTPMGDPSSPSFVNPGAPEGVVKGLSVSLANRLKGHADSVTTASWSSDGQNLISGSKECIVNVWTVPQAASLPTEIATPNNSTASAAAAATGLGVLKPCEELNMGRGANWTLASCFSPSDRFVAVAGLNQKISVGDWRFQHGRSYALHPMGNGDEHLGSVTALCWMGKQDGVLASGCSDSYLRIWDVSSRKMITRLDAQEDEVQCLAAHDWVPTVVLSGGADCNVRVHDARNGRSCVGILKGAESDVEDVRIFGVNTTTANFVASASRDGFCRIHDLRQPASPVMTTLVPENRGFTAIDFSPDGRWLYVAAARNEWLVVDAYTGHTVLKVNGHGGVVNCLRVSCDGRVCTGSDDQQILVWNIERPKYW